MSRLRTCVLLVVAGLGLCACTGNDARSAGSEGGAEAVASHRNVSISTSSWRPGDAGRDALIRGTLSFTPDGCPRLGSLKGVVWPAGFTSVVKADGVQVIVTADGREIAARDTVVAGGAAAASDAQAGMPCIEEGTTLTYIESEVRIIPGA